MPEIMISAVGNELMTLSITFLTNSDYIKNPYLKAKLVSLLFHGTWPVYHRTKGVIGDALTGEKFANDNLLHALMKFYIGTLSFLDSHSAELTRFRGRVDWCSYSILRQVQHQIRDLPGD